MISVSPTSKFPIGDSSPPSTTLTSTSSADAHQQASLLETWNQEYDQLSAGHFRGSVDSLRILDMRLFSERMNRRVLQKGAIPENTLAIGLPVRMKGNAVLCGEVCHPEDLHIFSNSSDFEYLSPSEFSFIGVEMPLDDDVSRRISASHSPARSRRRRIRKIAVDVKKANEFREAILCLFQVLKRDISALDNGAQLKRTLVGAIADITQEGRPGDDVHRLLNPWRLVRRMREITLENPDCPITVLELSSMLGVSRRSMQSACHKVLGMTPVAYLRTVRLNRVRMELARAPTVTDAATQWGFWRLGHFAQEYRNLFGELPSETHKRR